MQKNVFLPPAENNSGNKGLKFNQKLNGYI